MNDFSQHFKTVNEPFGAGRAAFRLLFDLGIMISCLKEEITNQKVLDFGAGTGWIAEWLNRMGYDVTAFDINVDLPKIGQLRMSCDKRVNSDLIHFQCGDGHEMPFDSGSFAYICCFDTLHHFHDYSKVFSEFYRLLIPGGRAIFVEPGAKHSTSKNTMEFIEKYKKGDPAWIERDVVLEEIYQISRECGFSEMVIKPFILPDMREYEFSTWQKFRLGDPMLEADYLQCLKTFNYDSRVVFYLGKNQGTNMVSSIPKAESWFKKRIIFLLWKTIEFLR